MASVTDVVVPTTETVPKDLPDVSSAPDAVTLMLAGLLGLVALGAAYVAADVILPIVLAVILMLLLQPPMRLLKRLHMPRTLAALLLIFAMFGILGGIGFAVAHPARSWAERLPEAIPRLENELSFLSQPVAKLNSLLQKGANSAKSDTSMSKSLSGLDLPETVFRGTQHFASGLFETILVLFFLLVSGDTFLRRLVEMVPRFKDKRQVVDLSQQIEDNVSAYLLTITLMNSAVGTATALVMWACGVGDPILWGFVAFLLNFVPFMGPFLGVVIFLFVGLMAKPDSALALLPAALYLGIHILEGETITPMLLARRFILNPVLVIISLIFWFWMWGVPGAILSIPMLAITKIICDGVKPLNPIGHFLEGDA
jgi:predicted PurR-regulated permease PerM